MEQPEPLHCVDEMPLPSDQTNIKHKTERKKRKEAKKRAVKEQKEKKAQKGNMTMIITRGEVEVAFD